MKKLIRKRVRASLCLLFRRSQRLIDISAYEDRRRRDRFSSALKLFFNDNSPEMVRYFTFLIFQCWCINECKAKNEVTDKDLAEFLDQLNDLVASAYNFHKSNSRYPHVRYRTATG